MKRTNCFVNSAMLVGLALVNSAAWAQTGPFVYAANWGDVAGVGNISAYRAGTSGALVAVPGSPFLTGGNPASLTIEPTGRFVYVTSAYRTPGSVLAYAIDRSTGALSPVPGSPFTAGPRPFSVTVHPAGRFAYVMSTDSSNVITEISTFMIDRVTGALSQVSGSSLTLGTGSHSVAVDTTGRFAYVTNQFPDDVSGFTINNMTGALTPVPGSPFRAGRGPGAVTVDPTGRFVYVANFDYFFRSGSLSAFTIDGRTGTLRPINGSPYGILAEPKSLTVDPTGRFAYLAAFDAVLGFTIDSVTGALTPVGGSPFGTRFYGPIRSTPTSITIDPTGHVAYVANFNSPTVSAFAINRSTGALAPVAGSPFAAGTLPFVVAVTPGPAGLVFSAVVGLGGTFSSDDNYRHAFVAQNNGEVWEVFWHPRVGEGEALIASFDPRLSRTVGVAGSFGFGNVRHALVATDDGNVTDVVFSPRQPGPPRSTVWANFDPRASGLVAIGAYARQGFEVHAIVATSDGDLADLYEPPIFPGPVQIRPLTNFDARTSGPVVGVAGFFSSDQNFEHAIVGTLNGDVTEVFYRTGQPGVGRAVLAHFPPAASSIVGIGGFFSSDDNYRHAIVATSNGNVTEIFYNPYLGQGQVVLANFDPSISTIAGVAGFFSPDDNFRHVLVATSDGKVHEILYSPWTAPMFVREL